MVAVNEDGKAGWSDINDILNLSTTVQVATTENIDLLTPPVIDGITLSSGDRVLVKDQDTPSENGIYVLENSILVRSDDAADTYGDNIYVFKYEISYVIWANGVYIT